MMKSSVSARVLALVVMALCAALVAAAPASNNTADANAATPTFYKDVLPVLQSNCQVCHRPGGTNLGGMVAPMAFTDYNEARPWAKSIARQVQGKTMPPWHASPDQHGVFVNERTMDQEQIDTVVAWAKAGAPAGDMADAPDPIEWPANDGWSIGKPDLVINMGEKYFVEDDVEDQYITFETQITEEMMPEARWLKAVEFRPGSPAVHHIIARPLGGIAPGNDPTVYNDGFGTLIEPGMTVSWQMHYHKEAGPGTGTWDYSEAALRFYPAGYKPDHIVMNDGLARFDFQIPPGDPNYESKVTTTFERDSLLLGYTPHMHLRGKSAKYVATYPDGTQEVLLEVPKYDFNWQTNYEYPAPGKKIPAGTTIELTMAWDNSADNPANPDPTETVVFGRPTTAEMMFGFVSYADAEPGYEPSAGQGGLLGRRGGRSQEDIPERMKIMLKERFDVDWDSLDSEERIEVMRRIQAAREARQGAKSGD